eukprot:CAMPEP_0181231122 /NCGR_PEP_ID=MMETSP1096-20121128/34906_1 /TAXON_ID=156174 ORGANISM="Chrysochromulina ericina, Strain CCMP281" /NCGR_SAMPLE_ID=MMETSP1096 /ASSEMBLY_ACC=CAM_ASM_000453 /LENGTH=309 /DNA_ID=CAMNT_0023325079 /DNA_START=209 /DNA_END=1135 /DNA_ORIENTATION=-
MALLVQPTLITFLAEREEVAPGACSKPSMNPGGVVAMPCTIVHTPAAFGADVVVSAGGAAAASPPASQPLALQAASALEGPAGVGVLGCTRSPQVLGYAARSPATVESAEHGDRLRPLSGPQVVLLSSVLGEVEQEEVPPFVAISRGRRVAVGAVAVSLAPKEFEVVPLSPRPLRLVARRAEVGWDIPEGIGVGMCGADVGEGGVTLWGHLMVGGAKAEDPVDADPPLKCPAQERGLAGMAAVRSRLVVVGVQPKRIQQCGQDVHRADGVMRLDAATARWMSRGWEFHQADHSRAALRHVTLAASQPAC